MLRFNHLVTPVSAQWGDEKSGHDRRDRGYLHIDSALCTTIHRTQSGYSQRAWVPNLPTAENNTEHPVWYPSPGDQPTVK